MEILNVKQGINEHTFQPQIEVTFVAPLEALQVISEEDSAMLFYTKFKEAMVKYKTRTVE